MTASEWMEIYTASAANGLTAQATILTMVSGYLVVAYSVGSKLSTLQVVVANLIYLGGAGTVLVSNHGSVLDSVNAREHAMSLDTGIGSIAYVEGWGPSEWAALVVVFNALFVIFSFVFMWQVRRNKGK
jgi:hypothetical protein